jgi:hypothetical protein
MVKIDDDFLRVNSEEKREVTNKKEFWFEWISDDEIEIKRDSNPVKDD